MSEIPAGVRDWAALPGPARVLAAARAKAEAGRLGDRSVLARTLTDAERAEVGRLFGSAWQASGAPVRASGLRRRLQTYGVDLHDLLVHVGGPLLDRPAERAAAADRRATEEAQARGVIAEIWREHVGDVRPASGTASSQARWEAALRASLPAAGGGAASARAEELRRVFDLVPRAGRGDVVGAVPEQQLLAVLAARAVADAHALDRDRALGRAAARLAAHVAAARAGESPEDPLITAQGWRAAWAGIGVTCDEVSSMVLVLGLPLRGPSPAAAITAAAGAEPVWLTLRSLRPQPAPHPKVREVFVCENPSVAEAAADRLGSDAAPLICTFGRPSLAAVTLLRSVAEAGVTLRISADGDSTGTAIVADLCALAPGSTPWRVRAGVYEEQILDELLADLAGGGGAVGRDSSSR